MDSFAGLTTVTFVIMVFASLVMSKAVKNFRRELKFWLIGIYIQMVSSFLRMATELNLFKVFADVQTVMSGLAVLVLIYASFDQYRKIVLNPKIKPGNKKTTPTIIGSILLIQINASIDMVSVGILLVVLCLIGAALYFLYEINKVLNLPTHKFIMLSLFFAFLNALFTITQLVQTPGSKGDIFWGSVNQTTDALVASGLLTSSLVIFIEKQLVDSKEKVEIAYSSLSDQMEMGYQISEQLGSTAVQISASAEEVSCGSESIASSQQEISRGASEQVMKISETQKLILKLRDNFQNVILSVDEINQITDLISTIADQTNMLALNAAIESARAGDAGRGFKVVADQVRRLAAESKNALGRTNTFVVDIMNHIKTQQEEILLIAQSIDSIASVAEETSANTEASAAAAEEQAASMEQISSTAYLLTTLAEKLTSKTFSEF